MKSCIPTTCVLLCGCLLAPAHAQSNGTDSKSTLGERSEHSSPAMEAPSFGDEPATLEQRLNTLEASIAELREMNSRMYEGLSNLYEEKAQLEESLASAEEDDKDDLTAESIKALEKRSAELEQRLQALIANSKTTAAMSASTGHTVPQPVRKTGTLRVSNHRNQPMRLKVNDKTYRIRAHSSASLAVPVGMLTTQLIGYESPKRSLISAPHYEKSITIR